MVSFFWKDFLGMARALVRPANGPADPDRRMAYLILAATVPAGVVGFAFEGFFAGPAVRSPWVVVFNLVLVGALFFAAEAAGRKGSGREAGKLGFPGAVAVGLAQATALVPGVSRSGATIAMGLFLGLRREEAARFSFLMSVPIIAVAAGFSLAKAVGGACRLHGYENHDGSWRTPLRYSPSRWAAGSVKTRWMGPARFTPD